MAKDPAFLFYPNDWLGGTMYMSFEEKGAYMELLLLQFNQGMFTEIQAKQVLNTCSSQVWKSLKQKFKTDGTFFWNERLAEEIKKRKEYSKSRRKNLRGKKSHMDTHMAPHMERHMENENEDENRIINKNKNRNEIKGGAGGNLTREELIAIYQKFTDTILVHDDAAFEQMAMNEGVTINPEAVKDHMALLSRYPNMKPATIADFRQSLLKHCKEYKLKTDGTKKPRRVGTVDIDAAERTQSELRLIDEQLRKANSNSTN